MGSCGHKVPKNESGKGKGPSGIKEEVGKHKDNRRRLDGKVAIIIGRASGIGEATARLFSEHGAEVIIADLEDNKSLTIESNVKKAVDKAVKIANDESKKVDIMFNSAEILDDFKNKEEFQHALNGVKHGLKQAAAVMKDKKQGCIISTAYKEEGVKKLIKEAAAEHGKNGIRVNCVSSEAKGNADNRAKLTVDDIAKAVLFLASKEAEYISGHNLVVGGGITVLNQSWALYFL